VDDARFSLQGEWRDAGYWMLDAEKIKAESSKLKVS